jgi:DNA-binding CsgD family transcriptional regulator/PAS domain-containing protein
MSSGARDLLLEDICSEPDGDLRLNRLPFNNLALNSTVGVALFDEALCCRALSAALCRMIGSPERKQVGKSMQQVFPGAVELLEPAFRQVWSSGNGLPNVELSAQSLSSTQMRIWSLNFYPVRDEFRKVQLVAITFSDMTRTRCAEHKLHYLKERLREAAPGGANSTGGELVDLFGRTFDLVKRSMELLNASAALRSYALEMRFEAHLARLALFLCGTRYQELLSDSSQPKIESSLHDPSFSSLPQDPNKLEAGDPSPRERQLLYFLADGKSNKEIGSILAISTRTVETYRARIMLKLDLHSTAALVRYAIRHHIVEP